jgi:Xaa-Pro aminopeptidase
MAAQDIHRQRRERLMGMLGDGAALLLVAPPEVYRNADVHHTYRISSDFYYLTGFTEPESAMLYRPGADRPYILFVRPRDPDKERWEGRRVGVEGAVERLGADAAYEIEELEDRLPELIATTTDLLYPLGENPEADRILGRAVATLRGRPRRGRRPPQRIADPHYSLHELRLRKDADELATLRKAAAITEEAHRAAMALAAPGVNEGELEAIVNYIFRRRGGAGPGYGTIVGAGANATILHYVENDQPLADGDLVLIDAGCELAFYTADITRTFPASGTFSAPQRRVYEVVLKALEEAVALSRSGNTLDTLHARCVEILTEGMVELGLLEGPASARIEDETYKRYYPHQTSHWLGMDVHDVGSYTTAGEPRPLEPGMVLTIEPGLYIPADDEQAPAELRGIGVRIEDNILITDGDPENLTQATPKTIDAIEAACAERRGGDDPARRR